MLGNGLFSRMAHDGLPTVPPNRWATSLGRAAPKVMPFEIWPERMAWILASLPPRSRAHSARRWQPASSRAKRASKLCKRNLRKRFMETPIEEGKATRRGYFAEGRMA